MKPLGDERILVTGAGGNVGRALLPRLEGCDVLATDIDGKRGEIVWYDVTEYLGLIYDPTIVFHLAASKNAPGGELDPLEVARTNIIGTSNVLKSFPTAKIVLTSTCKAADPETAYGASKLIAERMVLNAGGTVARLYNVIDGVDDNVFELWRGIPEDQPLPVTPCRRYFISMEQAVNLVIRCATLPTGRYTIDPGWARSMDAMAKELYPGRELEYIKPRRGDRLVEPLIAVSEKFSWVRDDGLCRIESPHDQVVAEVTA